MVPAQSKRRRLSLLSLPVVVAAGFLLVAKLASWQQSDLVKELEDCIAHGETREAIEAVHKLAAMPNPPISILVTAAAADEHETAEAGQVTISRLLRRWQRDMEAQHHVSTVGGQLAELARALAEQLSDFSTADHAWLASTAGKILRMANMFPPKQSPLVAIHCDLIMATVGTDGVPAPSTAALDSKVKSPESATNVSIPKSETGTSEGESSSYTPQPFPIGNVSNEPLSANDGKPLRGSHQVPPETRSELTLNSNNDATGNSNGGSTANSQQNSLGAKGDGASESVSSRIEPGTHSDWAQPMYRILPAMPADVGPVENRASANNEQLSDSPTNVDTASSETFAQLDSRELFRYWLALDDGKSILVNSSANELGVFSAATIMGTVAAEAPIESEIAKRGFGRVTPGMVRQFCSDDPELRIQTLQYALAQPGAGGGAWLLLLADDPSAEVRLFAVTLMTTSNDAALMEKAWQIALRDPDPRIADLASRLRERRSGTLRR